MSRRLGRLLAALSEIPSKPGTSAFLPLAGKRLNRPDTRNNLPARGTRRLPR